MKKKHKGKVVVLHLAARYPFAGVMWQLIHHLVGLRELLLDQWPEQSAAPMPAAFPTVGTWHNKGNDVEIEGRTYYWSKHVNFAKMLDVPRRAGRPVGLATDLNAGLDYERAPAGGFIFRPVVPMSLDIDISASRGEFTVAKDLYVSTRSGRFSDRTVCYLAAGRPTVTQFTGFEKVRPDRRRAGRFRRQASAAEGLREVGAAYPRHARAAREIARGYFDAHRLLGEMAEVVGL